MFFTRNFVIFASKRLNNSFGNSVSNLFQKSALIKQQVNKSLLRNTMTKVEEETWKNNKVVGRWLLACSGMCFGAVVIGGITRLTESGLSMTQWNLIKGMRPPQSKEEWEKEFEEYKQYPEYKYLERELDLAGFKKIFFWEYLHRMWGRSVGVVFALPAVLLWGKGYFNSAMKKRVLIFGALIGCQGLLGWYMVKSGLEGQETSTITPRVSPYRLAAHLSSAFIIYSLLFFQGINHIFKPYNLQAVPGIGKMKALTHSVKALVFLSAVSGAFVAGLDGGLVYNTWPKMADRWIPDDILALTPAWKNIFENATTTQFNHRHFGELTEFAILGLLIVSRKLPLPPRTRMVVNALAVAGLIQGMLGVATLFSYVKVELASSHQAGALVVLSLALWLSHELRRLPK